MTNENHPKIRDLLDNWDKYLEQLIAMPDSMLEKKARLARVQMQMAFEQKKFVEIDVLELFWMMIVEARTKRSERGLVDEDLPEETEEEPVKKKSGKKKQKEMKAEPAGEVDIPIPEPEPEVKLPASEQLSLF